MKKSLALVLALMMILSIFTMGISVSAADMPAGAIAISDVSGLASMEAGKYYYLTADITIGTPGVLEDQVDIDKTQPDAIEPAEEADLITIPAGATLDGNGFTIYYGNYITNPGWYETNNKFTHSVAWTHELFVFAPGDAITMKNLKFGSQALPVYLSSGIAPKTTTTGETAYTIYDGANDTFGMFRDDIGVNVNWDNVSFYVERYGRGLGSYNTGCVLYSAYGNHNFDKCEMNVSIMSAGTQYGLWVNNKVTSNAGAGKLTFTNCTNKGFSIYAGYETTTDESGATVRGEDIYLGGEGWGSVGMGFVWASRNDIVMTNCINNVNIGATYGGNGEKFGGFIGDVMKGSATITACVNNGDFSLNNITIGGGIVGRTQSGSCTDFVIRNCINNGDFKRSNALGTGSNHGFGGITGHSGSTTTYEVSGCINYGDIKGTGCIGGVVGFAEGSPNKIIKNNTNYGNIVSPATGTNSEGKTVQGNRDAGGVAGQLRGTVEVTNCKNFGSVAAANKNGGVIATLVNDNATLTVSNCVNYGAVGNTSTTHAGGIISAVESSANTNVTMNSCINYGKIVTKQYSAGMIAEMGSGSKSVVINTCQNFGEIAGVHAVAGFIGQTANDASLNISINNSLNAGDVHQSNTGGEGIGGFFGRIAGPKTVITMTGCINTGTVVGSTKASNAYGFFGDTFGQFIGAYTVDAKAYHYTGSDVTDNGIVGGFTNWSAGDSTKPTLIDCRALGNAVLADGAKSLKGWITGSRDEGGVVSAFASNTQYYYDENVTLTEPANNGYYGVNVEINANSTEIMGPDHMMNLPMFLYSHLKSTFGQDFMAGNTAMGENAVVTATPMLRGYQMSTDGASIRFIATINSSNYTNVGFVYSITANGTPVATDVSATAGYIWTALNVAGNDGSLSTVSAADLGAKYMSGITFNNIPAVGVYEFTVTPVATDANGTTVYTGAAYVITVTHGAVTSVTK